MRILSHILQENCGYAGNTAYHWINLMVDATPPEDFTVTVDPAVWTNNTQPVLSFSTSDQISGIDHYELAVDGCEAQIIINPYKVPVQLDDEHEITVTTVDKAVWLRHFLMRLSMTNEFLVYLSQQMDWLCEF